jgi:hypothetical protein
MYTSEPTSPSHIGQESCKHPFELELLAKAGTCKSKRATQAPSHATRKVTCQLLRERILYA